MAEEETAAGTAATRIYRDEPIPLNGRPAAVTPSRYREMRNIARSREAYGQSEAMIFHKQGKFMEDFEDDFEFDGVFFKYFPTYQAMTDRELRGYFSWRTRVRRGAVERTSLSFVFLYIYELLNQIGVKSPEEGFRTLKDFGAVYEEFEPKVGRYLSQWLNDYVVYYGLDPALLEEGPNAVFERAVLLLQDHAAHTADEVFAALNALSSYKLENSRFFRLHPEEVKQVVRGVFAELSDYYSRNRKRSVCERFFGKVHTSSYRMFRSAVFHEPERHRDGVYRVSDICRYICRDGKWSCERFLCYKGKIQQTGILLKSIDVLMRRKYQFKSTLKAGKIGAVYQEIIDRQIDQCLEDKRQNAVAAVEIDTSRLAGIRRAALEIQERLIVEETPEAELPQPAAAAEEPGGAAGLTGLEVLFLQCLLQGRDYRQLLKSNGLMPSVLVDSINETLFERFGDTAIVFDGDRPEVLEDYADELKGIVGE